MDSISRDYGLFLKTGVAWRILAHLHEGGLAGLLQLSLRSIHAGGYCLRQGVHNATQALVRLGVLLVEQLPGIVQQRPCRSS